MAEFRIELSASARDDFVLSQMLQKAELLRETAKYSGRWYKQVSPEVKTITNENIMKTKTLNIELPLIVKLGGPFEEVGEENEAVGGDYQKVG